MRTIPPLVSFCIPVYNEASIIESSTEFIAKKLSKLTNNNFEIILIDNGSNDETSRVMKLLMKKYSFIRGYTLKKKGHGLAFRKAIAVARGSILVLSAIDLPFEFSDLKNAMKIIESYDVIYGSKRHKKSIYRTSWQREASSFFFNLGLKLIFNIKLSDTQGSIIINRKAILPILKYCDADNAFFSTQIAIYSIKNGLTVTEVPVTQNPNNLFIRQSKYNIIRDGSVMLRSLYKEMKKT